MIAQLIVASGKSAGRSIPIKRGKLLIGRAEECDVRPLSEEVSRRHCAVLVGPADVWVEDLGSRNGTFVNGQRINAKTRVREGDLIQVGSLELKVSCSDPAAKAGSDNDVSKWLMTEDETASGPAPGATSRGAVDTTQVMTPAVAAGTSATEAAGAAAERSAQASSVDALKASRASPGLLPRESKKKADSSRDAAAEALKKFFENR